MKATLAQIKLIHVLANQQMDKDAYREMIESYGVTTSKALTKAQAAALIDNLQGKPAREVTDTATAKQVTLLAHLQTQCGREGAAGLAWAQSVARREITSLRQLTKSEASRAIQAALQMERELEKQALKQAKNKE